VCNFEGKELKKVVSAIVIALLLTSMLFSSSGIWLVRAPTIIVVPDDYPTIQAAVNAASPEDTVYVRTGTYRERIIINKALSMVGENMEDTIIDGETVGTCVHITSNNVNVTGFKIQNGYSDPGEPGGGVWLEGASYCRISGNDISRDYEICVCLNPDSNYNIVSDNIIAPTGSQYFGVSIAYSSSNRIVGNQISGAINGVALFYSNDNTILGNNITNSSYGIFLRFNDERNDVRENNITNNIEVGIRFMNESNDNKMCHNNFASNGLQALVEDSSNNMWDDGYPSGGNYWSNYAGNDLFSGLFQNQTGCDGIGDTPYTIDSNNIDNYPLMKPYPTHDVTMAGVTAFPAVVCKGYGCEITLTISNKGDFAETFDVVVWANWSYPKTTAIHTFTALTPVIGTFTNITLNCHDSMRLLFTWDTALFSFAPGTFRIGAYATQVQGETDIDNNVFWDGTVQIIQGMSGGGGGRMPYMN
jgi:parallel beta-helix repeat protein